MTIDESRTKPCLDAPDVVELKTSTEDSGESTEPSSMKLVERDSCNTENKCDDDDDDDDDDDGNGSQSKETPKESSTEDDSTPAAESTGNAAVLVAAQAVCSSTPQLVVKDTCANTATTVFSIFKSCLRWIWSLRVPLVLLTAIGLAPKLILLWIFIVLARPIAAWIFTKCPDSWRTRWKTALPAKIRNSSVYRDLDEGAIQSLPFILFWLYLCCAPFALVWIAVHWLKELTRRDQPHSVGSGFVFVQNKKAGPERDSNFYYSHAFAIVVFFFFALGIPALISYGVYQHLGIEKEVKHCTTVEAPKSNGTPFQETPDRKSKGVVWQATRDGNQSHTRAQRITEATAVLGYSGNWPLIGRVGSQPTDWSVFLVHFYLMSLASAVCMLLFRAWFFFPLNFLSDEHDVVFTDSGIKKNCFKGWFLSVVTLNRWATGGGPDSLLWTEVKSVRHAEEGATRLAPLPDTAFKKESLTYKLLNKLAMLIDGLSGSSNLSNYLIFSTTNSGSDFGSNIRIDLKDLTAEQRAKLFYSVKQWAPNAVIEKSAEEQMLGSTVLRDNRYTQLWFDMLTSRTSKRKHELLKQGETLKSGEYTIYRRIASGGQATTYLATKSSGEKFALKEFILAGSSTSGTLIESAREFEAEVSLLSQLDHPAIVKLHDYFCEDRRLYVALEYIDGQSLRQKVLSEGPLSESEVVRISSSVCEILEYLHGLNPPIVHRDITPENLLIEPDGTIKLIDFSFAVREGQPTTDSSAKQAFTPPEQFREEVCTQSDIYSLGATMYFLLTGRTPKPITPSSPREKMPSVSPELNAIVERATQLDLKQRYESANWMKLELDTVIRSEMSFAKESARDA